MTSRRGNSKQQIMTDVMNHAMPLAIVRLIEACHRCPLLHAVPNLIRDKHSRFEASCLQKATIYEQNTRKSIILSARVYLVAITRAQWTGLSGYRTNKAEKVSVTSITIASL